MTKKSRLFGQSTLIAASLLCMIGPANAGIAKFDGSWSVSIVAENGTCPTRTIPLRVSNGQIAFSAFGATASGAIRSNGTVNLRISHNEQVLNASGSVDGHAGSGSWRSPTASCDGTWTARKA